VLQDLVAPVDEPRRAVPERGVRQPTAIATMASVIRVIVLS
jgi:hypothetical protein